MGVIIAVTLRRCALVARFSFLVFRFSFLLLGVGLRGVGASMYAVGTAERSTSPGNFALSSTSSSSIRHVLSEAIR